MRPAGDADQGLQQDRDRPDEEPQRTQDLFLRIHQQIRQTVPRVSEVFDQLRPTGLFVAAPEPETDRLDVSDRLQSPAVVGRKETEVERVFLVYVGVTVKQKVGAVDDPADDVVTATAHVVANGIPSRAPTAGRLRRSDVPRPGMSDDRRKKCAVSQFLRRSSSQSLFLPSDDEPRRRDARHVVAVRPRQPGRIFSLSLYLVGHPADLNSYLISVVDQFSADVDVVNWRRLRLQLDERGRLLWPTIFF